MQIETDIERTHEDRQRGRFLKKNSSIYKRCQITEYSFEEIAELQITFPDNRSKNIIHHMLHEKEDIDRNLNDNPIDDQFVDRKLRDLIITPRDFTADWLDARQKARRRSSKKFEDEDEFEMSLEEEEASKREQAKTKKNSKTKKASEEKVQAEQKSAADSTNEEIEQDEIDPLKELQKPQFFETSPLSISSEKEAVQDQVHLDTQEEIQQNESIETDSNQNAILEKAIKSSYDEGYNQAVLEKQDEVKSLFKNIESIIESFNLKKKEMLSKTQSNFEELVGIITEVIIGKKLQKDGSLLADIIKKAISSGIKEENYKIFVSSKIYENFASYDPDFTSKYVIKDDSLKESNFRIESDQSVIESGIKEMVEEAIKKADVHLFEDE